MQRRVKRGWMNLLVKEVIDECHDTKTFVLVDNEDGGRPYDFIAGQYLTFRFDNVAEKPIVRSYTMSGSPCQNEATIFTVKRVEKGVISNWLCDNVKVGDILRARGPIGKFCFLHEHDKPHLYMVAGGSGVTPFISIIREYQSRLGTPGAPQSLHLLVAYRSQKDLISWKEILEARKVANIDIKVSLTREEHPEFWHGRPDREMIAKFITHRPDEMTIMTCGPQALMEETCAYAKEYGIPLEHIKEESFES